MAIWKGSLDEPPRELYGVTWKGSQDKPPHINEHRDYGEGEGDLEDYGGKKAPEEESVEGRLEKKTLK